MKVDVTDVKFLDMLFDPSTALIDPEFINPKTKEKAPRYGICPEYNREAIATIEDALEINHGMVEFGLEAAVKAGLVVKKERTDSKGNKFHTYHRVDPNFKRDNTEQLRKVKESISRFMASDEEVVL
jgi:hypothetical protein